MTTEMKPVVLLIFPTVLTGYLFFYKALVLRQCCWIVVFFGCLFVMTLCHDKLNNLN